MMWLKSCPRCKLGDMTPDEDGDRMCLQCGHIQRSVASPTIAETAMLLLMEDAQTGEVRRETALAI